MPPRNTDTDPVEDLLATDEAETSVRRDEKPIVVPTKIVWRNFFWLALLHVGSVYALFGVTWKCHWYTLIWGKLIKK